MADIGGPGIEHAAVLRVCPSVTLSIVICFLSNLHPSAPLLERVILI